MTEEMGCVEKCSVIDWHSDEAAREKRKKFRKFRLKHNIVEEKAF